MNRSDQSQPTRGHGAFERPAHATGTAKRAQRLRREMTLSEKMLWRELQKLKLHFRRQAPMGRYVADFIHHGAKLVVEVDGARHKIPEAQAHDAQRDAWFASQGYRVVRVRDTEVFNGAAEIADMLAAQIDRQPRSHCP